MLYAGPYGNKTQFLVIYLARAKLNSVNSSNISANLRPETEKKIKILLCNHKLVSSIITVLITLFLVPAGSPVARRGSGKSPSILSRLELVWNCMLNAQLDTVPASVRRSSTTTAAPAPSTSRSPSCSWSLASASLRDAIYLFFLPSVFISRIFCVRISKT